ncbi:MAG: HPr kinase/phosphorylase [Rhizobium sp.]|nr:HPr kinase/phosphorylase [Rhizobium sp.]
MNEMRDNIHGTAIVVDGTGLLFIGPSGSGKSALAFDCLAEAGLRGSSCALVADDQVFVYRRDGQVVAQRPEAIRGLIELRYSGIVTLESVEMTELHFAILPVHPEESARLPPEAERHLLAGDITLPVIRVPSWTRFPLALILAQIVTMEAKRR